MLLCERVNVNVTGKTKKTYENENARGRKPKNERQEPKNERETRRPKQKNERAGTTFGANLVQCKFGAK